MQIMSHGKTCALATKAVSIYMLVAATTSVWCQQRQTVVISTPATSTTYTQQLAIEVGDVPNHQVRAYEVHRVYGGSDAPVIAGQRVKESWQRAMSDYIDLNGLNNSYVVYVMESGDRFFARGHVLSESNPTTDGQMITKSYSMYDIWSGTGKFKNVRGTIKSETTSNIKAGINQTRSEVTVWWPTD